MACRYRRAIRPAQSYRSNAMIDALINRAAAALLALLLWLMPVEDE